MKIVVLMGGNVRRARDLAAHRRRHRPRPARARPRRDRARHRRPARCCLPGTEDGAGRAARAADAARSRRAARDRAALARSARARRRARLHRAPRRRGRGRHDPGAARPRGQDLHRLGHAVLGDGDGQGDVEALFEHAGIPTPAWRLYRRREGKVSRRRAGVRARRLSAHRQAERGGLDVRAHDRQGRRQGSEPAYEEALRYSNQVLVEAFIPGRELTVAVLGDQVAADRRDQTRRAGSTTTSRSTRRGRASTSAPPTSTRPRPRRCRSSRSAPAARSTPRASRASTSASRPTARRTASR